MSKLYEEIEKVINESHTYCESQSAGVYALNDDVDLSKAIEKICIKAQIEENESMVVMAEVHMNERAVFALKRRIEELQKQLENE